jgi:glucose-6-phosphate 1-dehydrogenase
VNSCTNSKFYSSVDALTFKKFIESADYLKAKVRDPKKKEELKRLADSLKETDNPVLIVVTPKR